MINAARGLGEAIVEWAVILIVLWLTGQAGHYLSSRSVKEADEQRSPEGTREEPVPVDKCTSEVLTAVKAAQLVRIGVRIEELDGQPINIEWTLHHNRSSSCRPAKLLHCPKLLDRT